MRSYPLAEDYKIIEQYLSQSNKEPLKFIFGSDTKYRKTVHQIRFVNL